MFPSFLPSSLPTFLQEVTNIVEHLANNDVLGEIEKVPYGKQSTIRIIFSSGSCRCLKDNCLICAKTVRVARTARRDAVVAANIDKTNNREDVVFRWRHVDG
jgi:hypothetical protein